MAKRVLIVNEGYSSNLGDQAIRESTEKLFQSFGYETSFCFFTNPSLTHLPKYRYSVNETNDEYFYIRLKKRLASILGPLIYGRYFFSMKRKIRTSLREQQFDFAVIGGGQFINSAPRQRLSFFAIALFLWTKAIKRSGKKVYLVGVGAAAGFHKLEKFLYHKSLDNTDAVWVRDSFSLKCLKEIFNKESRLIPDVAFFEPAPPKQATKSNTALVGIYSFSEYSKKMDTPFRTRDEYYKHWEQIVQHFLDQGTQVVLFYTTETDARETGLFQQYLAAKDIAATIAEIRSLDDLHGLCDTAAYVYSARMHALILGMKKGCKAQASVISQKLQSFADEYINSEELPSTLSKKLVESLKPEFASAKTEGL